jgi:2-amino-4-hydroxy-6-hydroxymethyldihydropteridine diphosphokinase
MQGPVRDPVTAFVALGANLGDAQRTVGQALEALAGLQSTQLLRSSRLYRTAPVEAQGPDFINAVAQIETRLTAPALLEALQALENQAGRARPYVNAPRTLDLDLLMYGQSSMQSARLILPHPRWRERAFVLRPLSDLAPELVTAADWARVASQAVALVTQP